jgi:hypothetical protein
MGRTCAGARCTCVLVLERACGRVYIYMARARGVVPGVRIFLIMYLCPKWC